jgi:hypothetical protein
MGHVIAEGGFADAGNRGVVVYNAYLRREIRVFFFFDSVLADGGEKYGLIGLKSPGPKTPHACTICRTPTEKKIAHLQEQYNPEPMWTAEELAHAWNMLPDEKQARKKVGGLTIVQKVVAEGFNLRFQSPFLRCPLSTPAEYVVAFDLCVGWR